MEAIRFKAIPTFRILDYDLAMKFYVQFLGFSIDWEHRFGEGEPVYMQISGAGLVLHLSENPRFPAGSIAYVQTKGIEAFHQQLNKTDCGFEIPTLAVSPWHTKMMDLADPFGNLLRFNEAVVTI